MPDVSVVNHSPEAAPPQAQKRTYPSSAPARKKKQAQKPVSQAGSNARHVGLAAPILPPGFAESLGGRKKEPPKEEKAPSKEEQAPIQDKNPSAGSPQEEAARETDAPAPDDRPLPYSAYTMPGEKRHPGPAPEAEPEPPAPPELDFEPPEDVTGDERPVRSGRNEPETARPKKRPADNLNPQGNGAQGFRPAQDHLYKRNLAQKRGSSDLPDIFLDEKADLRPLDEIPSKDQLFMELRMKDINEKFEDAVDDMRILLQDVTGGTFTKLTAQNISGLLRESENEEDFKTLYQAYYPDSDEHWEEKIVGRYQELKEKATKLNV